MDMSNWVQGVEAKFDESKVDVDEVKGRLLEIEQKMVRGGGGGESSHDTIGAEFVREQAAEIKAVAQRGRGTIRFDTKATITTGSTSGGALVAPQRDATLLLPRRRLAIRQLLNVVQVTSGSVEYPRMTSRPTAAAPQVETQPKAEGSMAFELKTTPIRTIAHWIPASVQILSDAPQLQDIIDSELRYGLAIQEESQLLYGSGTGVDLLGLVLQATPYALPAGAVAPINMIEQLGNAILQAQLTDVPVDGIVVHPTDWMRMRFAKDGQGNYLLGKPNEQIETSLFGIPVVPTVAMQVDKFLVGGFAAQTLYDRQGATVDISTEHADFFTRNLVAMRCEERIGLAAKQPQALIYGDFGNVA